jgi:DNA polymerase-1
VAAKVARARNDPVATAIVAAAEAGVRWRWCGPELIEDGVERLAPADQELIRRLRPEIEERLRDPAEADPEAILERLGIEVEHVVDPARAEEIIAGLPDQVGADTETVARPQYAPEPSWLVTTMDGRRAVHQPKPRSKVGLDPLRSRPRLHSPKRRVSYVFEFEMLVGAGLIGRLLDRQLIFHNALFDTQMVAAAGFEPAVVVDTTQLAAVALPPDPKSYGGDGEPQLIRLAYVAEQTLGIDLDKGLQTSDWGAPDLSDGQLAYSGADPAVAWQAARVMRKRLGEREMGAVRLANAAIPVIAKMALRGLPSDRTTHADRIARWEREYADQRRQFRERTGLEVPIGAPAIRGWLEDSLSPAALANWPRTDGSGVLKTGADEIRRLAQDYPEVLPLLEVQKREKRLSTFGAALLEQVSVVTDRLHGAYALPTITGRLSCRKPNLQQLPADGRGAVRAGSGKVLLSADYGQIELRILAARAGEEVMRAAFASGTDIHVATAVWFAPGLAGLSKDDPEMKLPRNKAKVVNYGLPYGMGAETLRRKAWKDFQLDLPIGEIETLRDMWFETYPAIKPYQQEQYDQRYDAVWSVAGRPRRACFEPGNKYHPAGVLRYTDCCNFGVQASASDLLLDAMVRVDKALPGTLVASVHDELLLEVPEAEDEAAARVLEEQMLAAFVHWFSEEPTTGVVEVKTVNSWSEAK